MWKPEKLRMVWNSIKSRCDCPSHTSYYNYGARGIRYCDEWRSFDSFISWANGSGYAEGLEIDRIDVNGNYEPSNCRWVTGCDNAKNKRNTIWVEWNGEKMCLSDACLRAGVKYPSVFHRVRKMNEDPIVAIGKLMERNANRGDLKSMWTCTKRELFDEVVALRARIDELESR